MSRNYREFPLSYFRVVEAFTDGRKSVDLPMTAKRAYNLRHDMYRFRKALHASADEDSEARGMFNIMRDLTFSMVPAYARGDMPCTLHVERDFLGELLNNTDLDVPSQPTSISPDGEASSFDIDQLERLMEEREGKENDDV